MAEYEENEEDVVELEAEKLERFKQMKRDAAKRFQERRAQEKADRIEGAKKAIESCKEDGTWDQLSDDTKAFLIKLTEESNGSGASNQSLFKLLFGNNPQVGDSFTLNEAFQKTLKGKSNLDHYVKKWAEKGIVVSYKQDADNILNSIYTLEVIGE